MITVSETLFELAGLKAGFIKPVAVSSQEFMARRAIIEAELRQKYANLGWLFGQKVAGMERLADVKLEGPGYGVALTIEGRQSVVMLGDVWHISVGRAY